MVFSLVPHKIFILTIITKKKCEWLSLPLICLEEETHLAPFIETIRPTILRLITRNYQVKSTNILTLLVIITPAIKHLKWIMLHKQLCDV